MVFKLDRTNWVWFIIIGLSALVLAAFQAFQTTERSSIRFLDVGQGDAVLIKTAESHQILIDAGIGAQVVDQLGKHMDFFDKSIDLFVLSHPDRDHFAGILDVLQKYRVERILMTGVASTDSMYREFLAEAKAKGAEIEFADADRDVQIGPDLFLDIIFPLKNMNLVGQVPGDKNNTSTMVRLVQKIGICGDCASCGSQSESRKSFNQANQGSDNCGIKDFHSIALLNGDAEFPEESIVMAAGEDVSADILKMGHHGSKFATSNWFLKAVSPKTVVASVGEGNSYGHPNPETLERVKGLEVRRTDLEGTIVFEF